MGFGDGLKEILRNFLTFMALRKITILILIAILIVGIFFIWRYLKKPIEQNAATPPAAVEKPLIQPAPIVSGPSKPIKLSCAKDSGARWQEGDFVNNPSAVLLDGGRIRIFYDIAPGIIKSAISQDGMLLRSEGIQKKGNPDTEESYVGSPAVLKTNNGWRMYYQGSLEKPNALTKYKIFTAFSKTGLNFSGQGQVIADENSVFGAKNPEAILLPGGKIRLYYMTSEGLKTAISDDGANFTFESDSVITDTVGVSVMAYTKDYYIALCAANPDLARPELQNIRLLNSQDGADFNPKICGSGAEILKTSTPYDFWGIQAPSMVKIGDMVKVFYQGFNVEPNLGGGSVILSATCRVE